MNSLLQKNVWLLCLVLGTNLVTTNLAYAYQTSLEELLTKIESQLRAFTLPEQDALRAKALRTCSSTIEELSQSAVGYALVLDQELPSLEALLKNQHPDLEELIAFEERLRLITPGPHQVFINQLQTHLSEYRRAFATNVETLKMARNGIATLRVTPPSKKLSESEQQNTSAAFSALYKVAIEPRILKRLQTTISVPNVQTQYRTPSLEQHGQKSFHFPIQSSTCTDRTRIQTEGTVFVSLVPRFAPSTQSIPLAMHVEGLGVFNATANRSPAKVSATFTVRATGLQPMQLQPLSIERKPPDVNVQVEANLQDVQLEGHLSRSRILRNILGRAIERKLEEEEPLLSQKIELALSQRANEEGEKLSYKINHLLTQSIWSRLESVRFTPDISLSSTPTYITSQSLYAYPDQLGALTNPPAIPTEINDQLDWTTHTHESAINNICRKVRGFRLDEATMRGVWQVQLKLTAPEWETPRSAVVPAVITFANAEPIRIEFREHRLKVHLTLHTASTTSMPTELPPIATTFSYSLAKNVDRFSIVRSPFTLPANLNDTDAQAWQKVLTRFFPETLAPIPKFRPSMWENFVSLRYLNVEDGWLSVGLHNVTPQTSSSPSLGTEKGTQP